MNRYFEIIDEIDMIGPEAISSSDVYASVIVEGAIRNGAISEAEAEDMRTCAIARHRSRHYGFGVDGEGVYVESIL